MEAAGAGMAATVEKGGRRREINPWGNLLAVTGGGGGGPLIVGGVLIAVAVGFAARRAWRRPPSSKLPPVDASKKAEEIKDFDGENGEKECQMDRKANAQENISVSKNPDLAETKESLDVKTLGETGCVLPTELGKKEVRWADQIEQTSEEHKFVLVDGTEKEIEVDLIESHADVAQNLEAQVLEKSELILVDEVGKEKEIALVNAVKEVEESVPSESEVAFDNKELKKAETEILNSEFSKEHLQGVHITAELVLSPTEEKEPGDEKTACTTDVAELVSTATQEIRAELVSAATEEIKNEESGSEITACVDEIAALVLAATKSINIEECRSVHITAELVLDDPEEIRNEENSCDERAACAEEIAELLLAAAEEINIEECQSDQERAALVLAAANEILKEEETGVCIGKVNEGIQSTNLEVGLVECKSDCIRDATVSASTEGIKGEDKFLLQESQVEIAEHESEAPEESEIHEQEEGEASSTEIQEESKSQLQLSQEEEDKETLSHESEHDIEEKEDKQQLNAEDSQNNESALATRKEIEKKEEEFSQTERQLEMTENHPQPIFKRVKFSIAEEIHKIRKEEDGEATESSAEMREKESSNSVGVSSAESNTETVWVTQVIEEKKILPAVQLIEEQKESIMVKKFHPSDDNGLNERVLKGANDTLQALGEIEEEKERERKESNHAKRGKTLKVDGFFMDHGHSRLFMVLLGMAFIMGILCFFNSSYFTKLSSELYQVIFPTVEETQQIEL